LNLEITQTLGPWAYVLLGLFVMFEGPLATLAGAVAASSGFMHPGWVFFAASAGNLSADFLWFSLGYFGKTDWLIRYGRWVGIKPEHIVRIEGEINRYAPHLLLLAKLTMGFIVPTLVATGMARVPLRRWFPSLAVGETIWTGTLVVLGFFFGRYVQTLENGIETVVWIGSLVFIAIIAFYGIRTLRQMKKGSSQ
jgi:membrane protein DedA with SNARE-associated domain